MKKIIILLAFLFACSFNVARASENSFDICESKFKNESKIKELCEKFGNSKDDETENLKSMKLMSSESSSEDPNIDISEDEEWTTNKTFDNKRITIEPGAELRIKEGVTITLMGSVIRVKGKLIADGTKEKPVVIRSLDKENNGGFSIIAGFGEEDDPASEISMKNTDISGNFNVSGAIITENTKLNLEGCNIHDNVIGIIMLEDDPNEKKVNHSKFHDNLFDELSYYEWGSGMPVPDFKYNWWGENTSKIEQYCDDEYGCFTYHDKMFGLVNIKPWFVSEDFFDPVIVIPGIMGSQEDALGWHLDPITHTYDNLILSFKDNGYEKGKNLFEFPYDWRNDNVYTAEKLKEKIDEIKEKTGLPAVDIVAHSMGGLLARQYIESDAYGNDVNQLITLGTPNKGAPEAYLKWEAGEGFFTITDKVAEKLFQIEALHSGYLDLGKYIREKIVSVGQLLPDYSYLKEASSGETRNYPNNYPGNMFLENLNNVDNLDNLNKINPTIVTGNGENKDNTMVGFRVVESTEDDQWEHGMPENFYDDNTDQGIDYGKGDETVPYESATGIDIGEKIEIESTHGDLPTKAQCDVIEKLLGKDECEYASTFDRILDIVTFGVFSPVDIQVVTPEGWAGKNILGKPESEMLSDAYYTGSDSQNEFLTIPLSGSGEKDFQIVTQGTGEGEYKIEIARITEDETSGEMEEITAAIEGSAVSGSEETSDIKIGENEITVESDKTPPEILIASPEENKIYPNSKTIPMSYEITDDKSSEDKITKEIYLDGNNFEEESMDPAFLKLGKHTLKIIAEDEAGNASQKEIGFETKADTDSVLKNVNYYHRLKLMKNQDKTAISSQLRLIDQLQKIIDIIEKNKFLKSKTKEVLIKNIQKQINFYLDWLSSYVRIRSNPKINNGIDEKVGELLIDDFNFLKYNF